MDYTFELSKSETSSPLSHPSLGMDDIYHSGIDWVVNFFRTEVKSFAADLAIAIYSLNDFIQWIDPWPPPGTTTLLIWRKCAHLEIVIWETTSPAERMLRSILRETYLAEFLVPPSSITCILLFNWAARNRTLLWLDKAVFLLKVSSDQHHISTHRREIARWFLLDGGNDTPAVNGKTEDILDGSSDPRADTLIALSQCSTFFSCHDFVLLMAKYRELWIFFACCTVVAADDSIIRTCFSWPPGQRKEQHRTKCSRLVSANIDKITLSVMAKVSQRSLLRQNPDLAMSWINHCQSLSPLAIAGRVVAPADLRLIFVVISLIFNNAFEHTAGRLVTMTCRTHPHINSRLSRPPARAAHIFSQDSSRHHVTVFSNLHSRQAACMSPAIQQRHSHPEQLQPQRTPNSLAKHWRTHSQHGMGLESLSPTSPITNPYEVHASTVAERHACRAPCSPFPREGVG